ncbi:preprotein translocase subunit YajC [Lichenifustis flavocetrariae]|uniref:Sec translocon accessory complex subunit YajC n=1 Tax=Lichenifustis flavocetrariae TaxID=2949735 RepID=A0AA42CGY0_9HYPH|nr:preprotein translocase subunit YajC [Lichenifustis flavocetrariae]MCW6506694.1 preprotein translocase subunit YajC [Lichenifustis flavocetrariae]
MFTSAFAQTPGALGGSADIIQFVVPMVAVLGIMYVLILRPQQKRTKDHQAMITAVRRGDTIVTTGGLIGKVTKATEPTELELEIAPNVRVRVSRAMISEVRAKGEPVKEAAIKP